MNNKQKTPCSPAKYCSTFRSHWAVHFNCQTPFESWQTQSFYDQAYYGTRPFTQEGRVWARAYIQVVSKECSNTWVISDQWQHYTYDHYRAAHCPPSTTFAKHFGYSTVICYIQLLVILKAWRKPFPWHHLQSDWSGQHSYQDLNVQCMLRPSSPAEVVVLNPFTCLTGLH